MRALVVDGAPRLVADYPNPHRKGSDALIRVLVAGICGTDLEITGGYRGFRGVLGHEFVGRVEEARSPELVGQRVCGEINISCGYCALCSAGMKSHCASRTVLGIAGHDGCFADYVVLPESNLHRVPEGIGDEEAVFVEPLAAAYRIVEQLNAQRIGRAVVLGEGRLGSLCALVLQRSGIDPLVVGKHEVKLAVLRSLGLRTANLGDDVPGAADLVVEATGSPSGLDLALDLVRPRGTVVLKSTIAGRIAADLSRATVNEVMLLGSRCGPFEPAIRALAQREVNVQPLITDCLPFGRALQALDRARESDALKVLLDLRRN